MAFFDRLDRASFRGAPFHVSQRAREGGRRGDTHEFPQREVPDAADTGRRARSFRVDGYVLDRQGEEYIAARDRLLQALERSGPGLYVDPWQGEWTVIARQYGCKESEAELGVARFTIVFEEAGEERFPTATADTRQAVRSAADTLVQAARRTFHRVFDLTGVPQFVADDAVAVVDTFVHALETGTAGLAETVDPGAVRASLAEMLAAYRTDLPNAVWDTLDGTVSALLASVVARVDDPVVAGDLFARLAAFDPGRTPVPSTTATRRRQAANRRALVDLIHTASVAAHAVTTTRRQLDSREEADAVRRHALAGLDQVRAVAGETASGDPVFVAMGILRAAVIRDLRTRSAGLPALRTVRTGPLTSAFALAWRLYGNAARGDEIMARNPRFTHPGKLPPQSSLDVLDG